MKVNLDRAKAAVLTEMVDEVFEAHKEGEAWGDAVSQVLIERVITKYQKHIAAALRSKGIEFGDDETLDGETLLRVVNERSGLDIAQWTPDAVKVALDAFMARKLSAQLGVEIASVQNIDDVKQLMINAAGEAVASGRATAFVSKAMIKKMRERRAWKLGGVLVEDRRKTLARWYQKKFRRSHIAVWRDAV